MSRSCASYQAAVIENATTTAVKRMQTHTRAHETHAKQRPERLASLPFHSVAGRKHSRYIGMQHPIKAVNDTLTAVNAYPPSSTKNATPARSMSTPKQKTVPEVDMIVPTPEAALLKAPVTIPNTAAMIVYTRYFHKTHTQRELFCNRCKLFKKADPLTNVYLLSGRADDQPLFLALDKNNRSAHFLKTRLNEHLYTVDGGQESNIHRSTR